MLFPTPSHLSCWHPGGLTLTQYALACAQKISFLSSESRFLDVGCGKGQSTLFLREQGFEVYGLDKTVTESEHKANVCATADALPFKDQTFNAILCECVLCLMSQTTKTLQEFHRVGSSTPRPALLLLHDMYSKIQVHSQKNAIFTQAELEAHLQASGWKVEYFEDHSHSLKAYAAQLAWYGACSLDFTRASYGYGLWIASKQPLENS